jgi:hypothetical protein
MLLQATKRYKKRTIICKNNNIEAIMPTYDIFLLDVQYPACDIFVGKLNEQTTIIHAKKKDENVATREN